MKTGREKRRIKQPWQLDLETRYTDAEAQTVADTQIATHTADDDAHHAKYTDAEAQTVADTQIATHTADDDAHHTPYTDADAEAVADTQIATHTADNDAHAITAEDIDTDVQTLLPAPTVTIALTALYVVEAISEGIYRCGITTLELNESQVLIENDMDSCTLGVSATGAVTVIAAGTDTYNLKLIPVWL